MFLEILFFYHLYVLFEIDFLIFGIVFKRIILSWTENDIIWYRDAYIYGFDQFWLFESFKLLSFSRFVTNLFFEFWTLLFNDMNLSGPEIYINWYREAYIYVIDRFQNFWKCSMFVIFHHFRGSQLRAFWICRFF